MAVRASGRHLDDAHDSDPVQSLRPPSSAPAVTVTIAIPVTSDGLSPQAYRLVEDVRELVQINGDIHLLPDEQPILPVQDYGLDEPIGADVRLLLASRQAVVHGRVPPLTRLEFDLLLYLAQHPRRVFTRSDLLTAVWGYRHSAERTVDTHVRRLRIKLGDHLPVITTVYRVGYRLCANARS
jgi:hypothetical protein